MTGQKKLPKIFGIIHTITYFFGGRDWNLKNGEQFLVGAYSYRVPVGSSLIHVLYSNIYFNFTTNDFRIPNGTSVEKPSIESKWWLSWLESTVVFNYIVIGMRFNIADVPSIKYDSEKQQIKIEPIPALMIKVYMKTGKWYTLSRSPTEMLSHSSGIKTNRLLWTTHYLGLELFLILV